MLLNIYLIGVALFLLKGYLISENLPDVPTVTISVLTSIIFAVLWPAVIVRLIIIAVRKRMR